MAKRYGINRTARTLRVSYYSLKERSEDEASSFPEQPGDGKPTFFELAAGEAVCRCECTLELEDAAGAKMRVHVKGVEAPDLAALTRSFREAEP
jgi:hypothetical protein